MESELVWIIFSKIGRSLTFDVTRIRFVLNENRDKWSKHNFWYRVLAFNKELLLKSYLSKQELLFQVANIRVVVVIVVVAAAVVVVLLLL